MSRRQAGTLPRLSRELVLSRSLRGDVDLPDRELLELPERAVQFGTGAFLRGFVEYFLDEANRRGEFGGRVVAISSTDSSRVVAVNEQDGLYTLCSASADGDGPRRDCRVIASLSRALNARRDWDQVLTLARNPAIEFVFSNTTEIGIAVADGDEQNAAPPPSFPGKLTRFLLERGRAFAFADDAGVVILPCELIERNGNRLRELVLRLARAWSVEPAFAEWIERAVVFCDTLVDRIVPGAPSADARLALEQSFGYRDELMIAAEPYRLFAIEASPSVRARLPFLAGEPGIVVTDDITPYRERKVYILNGGHTLLASVGLLSGCETVGDAMQHPAVGAYLRQVLFDEIVPALLAPNGEAFAREVIARFANPGLRHALADIVLQHTAKMRVRVVPSILRFAEQTGRVPTSLAVGFAAYLALVRLTADRPPSADAEGERVRALWRDAGDDGDATLKGLVGLVCGDASLWGADLSSVPGFVDAVAEDLIRNVRRGIPAALEGAGGGRRLAKTRLKTLQSGRSRHLPGLPDIPPS